MLTVIPVILSGGSGSRLWPRSRALYPKQLLPLVSAHSMLQETVLRLRNIEVLHSPIIIANHEHRFIIAEQLQAIGIEHPTLILEPEGKNTAPAAVIAALYAQQQHKDAILLLLPADHVIQHTEKLHQAIAEAVSIAQRHYLVTFGIKATVPETGYGYIQCGEALSGHAYALARFVEKPNLELAQHYIAQGDYLWNSGMFVFSASALLNEISIYAPLIHQACEQALDYATTDLDFIRLDVQSFQRCPEDSIDYAVMEKTSRAAVILLDAQWSDVGAWSSLWHILPKDEQNNVLQGDILVHKVSNSYISAQKRLVTAIGLDHHIIIETADAVLVADRDHAQDVKALVQELRDRQREEHTAHTLVHRPWGSYETIDSGDGFKVKRIVVKPKARLSLQLHHHRAEHWVVVKGVATVTCGDKVFDVYENQSTYIPIQTKHRLENKTDDVLALIEIQSGNYLGEDDIVRFDDDYQRATTTSVA